MRKPNIHIINLQKSLVKSIQEKKLLPGEYLPSENVLAEKFNLSRSTVRAVLAGLEKKQLVIKKPGKGTMVNGANRIKPVKTPVKYFGVDLCSENDFGSAWYYGKLMEGIKAECETAGGRIILVSDKQYLHADIPEVNGQIILKHDTWPEKAILILKEKKIPVAVINRMVSDDQLNCIAVNNEDAAEKAVDYLICLGHTKIGIIGGVSPDAHDRKAGYVKAMGKKNITVYEDFIFMKEPGNGIFSGLKTFLAENGLTAVFVCSGYYLSFTAPLLAELKIKVPEDMSVICFDDVEGHGFYPLPQLTCVRQPLFEMGMEAVRMLSDNAVPFGNRKIFDAEIVVRKSCGEKIK